MRAILVVITFVLVTQAWAQNEVFLPQTAPVARHADGQLNIVYYNETKPKVLDRKFLLLAGMATTATFLDVATTSHCISTYRNCQEGNPLVGSNPSATRLYGISFSILAGQILTSAWLRREMPHRKLWMIPPVVATVGHGLAAGLNLHTMRQLGASPSQ